MKNNVSSELINVNNIINNNITIEEFTFQTVVDTIDLNFFKNIGVRRYFDNYCQTIAMFNKNKKRYSNKKLYLSFVMSLKIITVGIFDHSKNLPSNYYDFCLTHVLPDIGLCFLSSKRLDHKIKSCNEDKELWDMFLLIGNNDNVLSDYEKEYFYKSLSTIDQELEIIASCYYREIPIREVKFFVINNTEHLLDRKKVINPYNKYTLAKIFNNKVKYQC